MRGASISLWIGHLGPFEARVFDTSRDLTEAMFLTPLYPPMLEHIARQHAESRADLPSLDFKSRRPFDDGLPKRRVG